jgi:alpha-1,3-glucan synthase
MTRRDPTDGATYSLNTNETATNPLDYSGVWENHNYHPSPDNWRFPVYTIFLDRFVNGDPTYVKLTCAEPAVMGTVF